MRHHSCTFSFVHTLCVVCVCVCARFTFLCPSCGRHKASVVVRKSNLCKHSSWWWVVSLSLCERSPRAFLQCSFFFFLLVPTRGRVKDADACEDTFDLDGHCYTTTVVHLEMTHSILVSRCHTHHYAMLSRHPEVHRNNVLQQ